MIYYLAISRKKLMGRELEDYLSSKLDGVSPRTIHRWMRYVKGLDEGGQTFDYYPQINLASFGLEKYEVIFRGPKDARILDIIPHIYWAGIVRDSRFEEYIVAHYLIPPEYRKSFEEVLGYILHIGKCEGVEVNKLRGSLFIPSPFHEIITPEGQLRLDGNIDNSAFVNCQGISEGIVNLFDDVRSNPIIVPIVFESDKESSTYGTIWKEMKSKIGGGFTDYFRGYKHLIPADTRKGSIFVQRTFQQINTNFNRYYEHMRVYFKPFYEIPNVQILNLTLSFDPDRSDEMLEVTTRISERCIYLTSYFADGSDGIKLVRMSILTTFDQFFTILKWVKHLGIRFDYYFVDRVKSWNLWDKNYTKFAYWDLFDPKALAWRFDPAYCIEKASAFH